MKSKKLHKITAENLLILDAASKSNNPFASFENKLSDSPDWSHKASNYSDKT
jgi:hypothetical protein